MGWGCCIFEVHRAGHRVLSENPESGIPKSPLPKPSEVKTPSGGFVISNPFPLTAGDTAASTFGVGRSARAGTARKRIAHPAGTKARELVIEVKFLPVLLMLIPLLCSGQGAPVSTPVEPATGLPLVLRVLPKPEVEPWSKITAKQRWDGYVAFTFSPFAGLGAASGAAISQAINSPEEWGQGWGAYGIRVTSSYGATLVGNTVTFGTSALFHEDNRYFRSHSDGFFGRLGHVIGSPYVARNDTGRRRFSASMFMGSAAYSGVQLAWSPSTWQGWDDVGINYLIWYGQVAGVNLVKEFYPTMVRHFQLKKKPETR